MDKGPNFPASFVGYDVLHHYGTALAARAGRAVPLVVGNDGNMGGVAEAQRVRSGTGTSTVVMLAPGSGLGLRVRRSRTACRSTATRSPAWRRRTCRRRSTCWASRRGPCGCGRTWGCVEMYTTLAGLP